MAAIRSRLLLPGFRRRHLSCRNNFGRVISYSALSIEISLRSRHLSCRNNFRCVMGHSELSIEIEIEVS